MSSLEINKIVAAILTAALVAMMSGFIAEVLMHKPELTEKAFPVVVAEGETPGEGGEAAAPAVEPVLPLLASADPAAGEKLAQKCAACHTFEQGGANKIGPNLWNVVNAQVASAEGFSYSSALQDMADQKWTYQHLNQFLHKPAEVAPGTKMTFAGLSKAQDRADVIAYLRSLSDQPAPLPTEEEIAAAKQEMKAAEEGAGAAQQAAGGEPIGPLIAEADVEAGEKAARKCAACHTFEAGGPNKIGPNLHNVVGRPIASHEGFSYSSALEEKAGQKWTYENLNAYLTDPQGWASGTKMTFPGINKTEERAAVIAYLRSATENPPPLPGGKKAEGAQQEAEAAPKGDKPGEGQQKEPQGEPGAGQ